MDSRLRAAIMTSGIIGMLAIIVFAVAVTGYRMGRDTGFEEGFRVADTLNKELREKTAAVHRTWSRARCVLQQKNLPRDVNLNTEEELADVRRPSTEHLR